jgi:hypothetical protein
LDCIKKDPFDPNEVTTLLAELNRKAHAHPDLGWGISEACQVSYMPPPPGGIQGKIFDWAQKPPTTMNPMRHVLNGIDLTSMTRDLMKMPMKPITP